MKKSYQIFEKTESRPCFARALRGGEKTAERLAKDRSSLLPMVELVEPARMAVDEVVDVAGRRAVEALFLLSAQGVAGPRHQRKPAAKFVCTGRRRASCRCRTGS